MKIKIQNTRLVKEFIFGIVLLVGVWFFENSSAKSFIKAYYDRLVMPVTSIAWDWRLRILDQITRPWMNQKYQQELLIYRDVITSSINKESELLQLKSEIENLKSITNVSLGKSDNMLMTKVISRTNDLWRINSGSLEGVTIGAPVLINGVWWGQVAKTSEYTSWVKTLSSKDNDQSVEIVTNRSVTVTGTLTSRDGVMVVTGLLISDPVSVGDLVVSLGNEKIPAGLPIGRVVGLVIPDEGSLYQYARIAWPIGPDNIRSAIVILSS